VYIYAGSTPGKPLSHEVAAGWQLWQDKNCQSCHQLYGLGGYMGPDLTNVASQKGTGYMRGLIQYGTNRMPDFNLNDTEVNNVIAFLCWVDKSGTAKVPDSLVHWTGSYTISAR